METLKMEIPQVYYIGNIRVENYAPGQHTFSRLAAHLALAIEAEEKAPTAQSLPETAAQEVAPTTGVVIGAIGRQAT